jgi:hypothetical protein
MLLKQLLPYLWRSIRQIQIVDDHLARRRDLLKGLAERVDRDIGAQGPVSDPQRCESTSQHILIEPGSDPDRQRNVVRHTLKRSGRQEA